NLEANRSVMVVEKEPASIKVTEKPPASSQWGVMLGEVARIDVGLLPDPSLCLGLSLSLSGSVFRLEVEVLHGLSETGNFESGRAAEFAIAIEGRLAGCLMAWRHGRIVSDVCLGAQAAAIRGVALGLSMPITSYGFWLGFYAGAPVTVQIAPWM